MSATSFLVLVFTTFASPGNAEHTKMMAKADFFAAKGIGDLTGYRPTPSPLTRSIDAASAPMPSTKRPSLR